MCRTPGRGMSVSTALVPVFEDVGRRRQQGTDDRHGAAAPEEPPGRPEYEGEGADQESDHDDGHCHPGDGPPVIRLLVTGSPRRIGAELGRVLASTGDCACLLYTSPS